jgi:hypothetical protein
MALVLKKIAFPLAAHVFCDYTGLRLENRWFSQFVFGAENISIPAALPFQLRTPLENCV